MSARIHAGHHAMIQMNWEKLTIEKGKCSVQINKKKAKFMYLYIILQYTQLEIVAMHTHVYTYTFTHTTKHTCAKAIHAHTHILICTPISRRMNSVQMKKIEVESCLKMLVKNKMRATFCNLFHM